MRQLPRAFGRRPFAPSTLGERDLRDSRRFPYGRPSGRFWESMFGRGHASGPNDANCCPSRKLFVALRQPADSLFARPTASVVLRDELQSQRKAVNMSLLMSDAKASLELQRHAGASIDGFGDVQLAVRLVTARFQARNDTVWIAAAARDQFLAALNALEQSRSGEARLEAMSPHDLAMRVAAYDKAGHIVVRGHVGGAVVEHDHVDTAHVPFSIEIEPSTLPSFIDEMSRLLAPSWRGADVDEDRSPD